MKGKDKVQSLSGESIIHCPTGNECDDLRQGKE